MNESPGHFWRDKWTTVMEQVPAPFGERRGMVWVGSGHSDNLKALEWFVTQVSLPPVEHDPSI